MIYLVRHGETAFNRDGLGLGRSDVGLTVLGLKQAEAVGGRFKSTEVGRIVTSPLLRAARVASEIARHHGVEPEAIEELTELDVGETEGLPFAEMRARFPEFLREWSGTEGHRARMPGGESMEDLDARLTSVAREMLAASESSSVVVVSHNFTLRALLCRLLGLEVARFRAFELGLASVSTVAVRSGRAGVRNINDVCHLANLNLA